MSNTVPEQRVDKNGKVVTKHVNPNKGSRPGAQRSTPSSPTQTLPPVTDDYRDPFYGPMPSKLNHLYEGANTFAEIDAVYFENFKDGIDGLELRWAGINRGRELRAEGKAPLTPYTPTAGLFGPQIGFGQAQNVIEVEEMYALSTEEPPGDGELPMSQVRQIFRGIQAEAQQRMRELRDSGAVPKNVTLNFN